MNINYISISILSFSAGIFLFHPISKWFVKKICFKKANELFYLLNQKKDNFEKIAKILLSVKSNFAFEILVDTYGKRKPLEQTFRINAISLRRTILRKCSLAEFNRLAMFLENKGINIDNSTAWQK
jgi:hypothetical protein